MTCQTQCLQCNVCPISGSFSLLNSALRRSFYIALLYISTVTFQTKFSFSKVQLNTRADLSVASSLQEISNVRDLTKDVFLGNTLELWNSTAEQAIFLLITQGLGGLLICEIVLNTKGQRNGRAESQEVFWRKAKPNSSAIPLSCNENMRVCGHLNSNVKFPSLWTAMQGTVLFYKNALKLQHFQLPLSHQQVSSFGGNQ